MDDIERADLLLVNDEITKQSGTYYVYIYSLESEKNLEEFQVFGKLLNHWKTEIKNSFITVDTLIKDKKDNLILVKKRLSNGPMEGCNSRIKCIIKNANGYKNFDRFRKRIFFSINKNTPIKNYKK